MGLKEYPANDEKSLDNFLIFQSKAKFGILRLVHL